MPQPEMYEYQVVLIDNERPPVPITPPAVNYPVGPDSFKALLAGYNAAGWQLVSMHVLLSQFDPLDGEYKPYGWLFLRRRI